MTDNHLNRYSVPEDEDFQPGSNEGVLKNFLDVTSKEMMEAIEEQELQRTEMELLEIFDDSHRFNTNDLCNIHELWLGDIYPFAGKYRTVNVAKAGFTFAPAARIDGLMSQFEQKYLALLTPCHHVNVDELAYSLGIVHVEFILIHPFCEGNGRTARLLSDLMAMQAGKPPLNYAAIDQTQHPDGFSRYILAIHAGFSENYSPIQDIFKLLIEQST